MERTESISIAANTRIGVRDGPWFAAAVLFHALLLTIPIHQAESPQARPERLAIALQPSWRPLTPAPPPAKTPLEPPGPTKPELPPQKPQPAVRLRDTLPLQPGLPQPPTVAVSAARLLDSASRIEWPPRAERASRRLGVFTPQPIPDNWRPRILVEDNRFDDAVLPTKTVIIDRWLAADGSHNVVIETSGGHTLCGRAVAWSPMNPLYEPIMMFRLCGGGGERSFKMPQRFHAGRDLPDIP